MLHGASFDAAYTRFRTHPVQTWLTLTGLVVGTAAIIVIVALGLSGRAFVMDQIEAVGSHLVWAYYESTVRSGVSRTMADRINEADSAAVAARSELFSGVTAVVDLRGTVTVLSRPKTVTILGTTANYPVVRRNLRILRGRFLDEDDIQQRAKVCVASRKLYEELFAQDESTQKTIHTLGMAFLVIGEFEEPVDTLGQGDVRAETIFIPTTVAWFFTPTHQIDTLFAEVREFSDISRATTTMQALLTERHHEGSVFRVQSMTTVILLADKISSGLIVVFILAAAVSVVVGGVGIMNILLASVEQRTREIGLRRSVGARRVDILRQFVMEALMLGAVGSALGVLAGLGIPVLARLLIKGVTITISPLSALLAFLFSCGVTLVCGMVPAYRAAHLEPTEALRHE